jgi:tetratricopeptide (TPR) repeat protein
MGKFRYKQRCAGPSDSSGSGPYAPARAPRSSERHYRRRTPAPELDAAQALQNQAHTLRQNGRLAEALDLYEKVLDLKPELTAAHLNLGIALQNEEKLEESLRCYQKVLLLEPELPAVHNNIGSVLRLQGKLPEAAAFLEKAIELDPNQPVAYNNLGAVLQAQKKWDEALAAYERARTLAPQDVEAYNNIGYLYSSQEKLDLALEWYSRAHAVQPDAPAVHNNAGNVLRELGRLDRATESYRRALAVLPDFADAWSNLGNSLREQGHFAEAIAAYTRAVELKPDNAGFHWNQALAALASGDLERGWAEYHWGFGCKQRQPLRQFRQAPWEGQNLTGKTVLAWAEQGVGDEIMFANCIPDLAAAADHCVVECDPRLVPLFARSFDDCEVIPRTEPPQPRGDWPDIDLQAPMGNLPRWLRPTLRHFPQDRGYLRADPTRVAYWKQRLAGLGPGLKTGISWRSRIMTASRRKYYVPLDEWGSILQTPGVQFVNLQYSDHRDDLEAARSRFGVQIHHFEDLNLKDALDDVAALITALNLNITIGNINLSLGGAVNTETWCFAVRHSMTWTALGTDGTPWFPSVRLLLRNWDETWAEAVGKAAAELRQRAQAFSR